MNCGESTQPGGFITDMSNGDDSGAIVSMGCENIFRRHRRAPLRSKFVQKSLKRSLRMLHYPSSPEKGAEIEPFASASTLPDSAVRWRISGWRFMHSESSSKNQLIAASSFTLLGRQSRYGAEALAASVLALRNRQTPVWRPPPEQAGLVLRGGFRRRSRNQ